MDENDAGPPQLIDDYAKGKLWAPKRQELQDPSEQGFLPLNVREDSMAGDHPANEVLPWDHPLKSRLQQGRGAAKWRGLLIS
eukprot:26437_6